MGTQTQDQNRQQQGGGDKSPTQTPNTPHDPEFNPERDGQVGAERRTADRNTRTNPSGAGKRSPSEDSDDDEETTDSGPVDETDTGTIDEGDTSAQGGRKPQ